MVSYAQQCSAYYGYIRTHPDVTAYGVHKHFAKGVFGMRKTDSIDLAHKLKGANEYRIKMHASKAPTDTKTISIKSIYQRAKKTSRAEQRRNPDKEGKKTASVRQLIDNTFGTGERPDDFAERY